MTLDVSPVLLLVASGIIGLRRSRESGIAVR
jgi:hypothetical protein